MLADYSSGSDDADPSKEVPGVIDVDQSADYERSAEEMVGAG